MTSQNMLDYNTVSRLLRYDPESGLLFWLERPSDFFSTRDAAKAWNNRYAGKEAFTAKGGDGYKMGAVFKKKYKAHRLAWLLHYGRWPLNQIDHINGIKTDNRIINLRDVTAGENNKNTRISRRNRSGCSGVRMVKGMHKWRVDIRTSGKLKHIGYFDVYEDAIAARKRSETENGFHENHGKRKSR